MTKERFQTGKWLKGLALGLAFLYTLALPAVAVFAGADPSGALILAGVGTVAMLFTRLDDLVRFSGFGLEAELQEKINEANATIAQLQELALAVAAPALTNIAAQGYLTPPKYSESYAMRQDVLEVLRGLRLSPEVIARVDGPFRARSRRLLVAKALQDTSFDQETAVQVERLRAGDTPMSADEVEKFLAEAGEMPSEQRRVVANLREFEKRGVLRDPTVLD